MIIFIYFGSCNFSTDGGALLRCTNAECAVLIGSHHHKKSTAQAACWSQEETHVAWTTNRLSPSTLATLCKHMQGSIAYSRVTGLVMVCDAAYHITADGYRAIERGW